MIENYTYTDQELFKQIVQGDELAFEVLYKKYADPLYAYVLKVLKSPLWAEEIVQDVFMNLWIKRQNLGIIDNPSAFLYRMAANRTVDWIRKNDLDLKTAYYLRKHAQSPSNTTEEMVNYKAIDSLVKEAIQQLAPQRKLIYNLKNETGLSYDEIALQLDISIHTVRNQLAKALESIKNYLKHKGVFMHLYLVLIQLLK